MSKSDILTLLERDHREAEGLLKNIVSGGESTQRLDLASVQKIIKALDLHTKIEETYLYPKAEKEREASNLVQDFYSEHREVKDLLKALANCKETAEAVRLCQKIMIEVQRHVHDEENQLFPLLRANWDEEVLMELGDKMMEMKDRELSGH
jgi:hemerythrin superfamily protein